MGAKIFDINYIKWKAWGNQVSGDQFGKYSQYQKDYYHKVLQLSGLSAGAKILEIGFGNGSFLSYCRDAGIDISGTEINSELLLLAQNYGYTVYPSNHLELDKSIRYDLILAFDVIEHIDPTQTLQFLAVCKNSLVDGGQLVLRFPNGDSPFSLASFNGDVTHCNWIGTEKMVYYSMCAEFKELKIIGTPQVIFTKNLKLALYHLTIIPIKKVINLLIGGLFYPGRGLNFVAVDLLAFLKC